MKTKQIIIVVCAFVLLAVIYFAQNSGNDRAIEGLGYEKILGDKTAKDDIKAVKCFYSGKEDEAVQLALKDDKWIVTTKFDAPANRDKVDGLLDKLENLEGELRSTSDEVLADYELEDNKALHLVLLDSKDSELKHLLIGKQGSDYNKMFVRLKGSNDVYLANQNLRSDFGIYGQQSNRPLESKSWCDLQLLALTENELQKIEVTAPHKKIALELQEQIIEEPEAPETDTETPVPPQVEKKWVVIEPKLETEAKESGINRLVRAFSNVNVSDVIARGGLAEYGLEKSQGTCTVTGTDGEKHTIYFGSPVPDGNGAYYVRIDEDNLVYRMEKWKVENIFMKMNTLITLDAPKFNKDDITSLELKSDKRSLKIEKKEDKWQPVVGEYSSRFNASRIDKVLAVLANANPQDKLMTESKEIAGLDNPDSSISFTLKDGTVHTIKFGATAPLTDQDRFVQFDDSDDIWMIQKANYNNAIPKLAELFDLKLFDFNVDDARHITLADNSGELKIVYSESDVTDDQSGKPETKWVIEGKDGEVDQGNVRFLLSTIRGLTAESIAFKKNETGLDNPSWKAELNLADGRNIVLLIGNERKAGGYFAGTGHDELTFVIDKNIADRLKDISAKLRE